MLSNFFQDVFPCAFGRKIVGPYDETRLVEKSSFQGKNAFYFSVFILVAL